MAGNELCVRGIPKGSNQGIYLLWTKYLWRPGWYVVMGAPGATGSFEAPRGETGYVRIPIDEARDHFKRQYDKLLLWLRYHRSSKRFEVVSQGNPRWLALRRLFVLFESDEYLTILRTLAEPHLEALTFSLSLDTPATDIRAFTASMEEQRQLRTKTFNRILDVLGEDTPEAAFRALLETGESIAPTIYETDARVEIVRWLIATKPKGQGWDHPLLTEDETDEARGFL